MIKFLKSRMKAVMSFMLLLSSFAPVMGQQVWSPDNGNGTFTNPLMWGDWPDPDVIRVGDDFYLISTSMHYVPGSPIAKSKDLVNWEIVGYPVDRYDEDPRFDMNGGNPISKWVMGQYHQTSQREVLCGFLYPKELGLG
ncbi:family 43 glycosylhydrolase [Sphingobacterium sp. SG20118]|uniref:family 43 glycosylhydrolase n=1 Tax=Sphingobacterium sp. SG20118 TaxID=3367156 RepID=UPI0037DFC6D7